MAFPSCLTPLTSLRTTTHPDIGIDTRSPRNPKHKQVNSVFQGSPPVKSFSLITKAANNNRNTKPNSVICADCDGNGAVLCSQCKGSGVNSVDIFNGQFKAGESCWLCGGRKEMLCGNCNGAGFVGGFLSTYDQ
ncbi:protein BUNDLE SHEATH DEFECTIVE 2, chloroplastic-like [Prosopis cineraria]|uniref:protein BUNDLE SHEATH DEFECTIVE 2, chloroplastic-like n=1 Tax=Prosopis cineraria TaxID=364024 RepID=UPI00240F7AEC|nr:protein BUNDLE SHEATH DEFECTIVE 2, chloroplastic-like [Prosopis cineraria]